MKAMCCLIGPALLVLTALAVQGTDVAQQPVVLSEEQARYELGPDLMLWEDASGEVQFTGVRSGAASFEESRTEVPSFGYTDAAYWARFTIVDEAPETVWVLEVANKSLDYISLYTPTDSGYVVRTVGDALPFDARVVEHRNHVFPLDPAPGVPQTYYLRVASRGPVSLPVWIWTAEAFLSKDQREQFFLGMFFGILAIMVVYNLTLFFVFRHRSYLYYVLYILSYIAYQLSVERIAFQYVWPDYLWWSARASTILGLVTAIWGLQFSRSFLHTAAFTPRLDRVIQALIALCLPLMGAALGGLRGINTLAVLYIIGAAVVMMTAGIRCLMKGDPAARYYLLAWSFLLLGVLIGMLRYLGAVPHNLLAARSVQVGSVLEVTLLSLALGYRYNLLRRERERMRLRIAGDLHDDIGSGLTQISLYSELVRRNTRGQPAEWAENMGALARRLTDRMQDIVWAIKPADEPWEALEGRMKDYAKALLTSGDLDFYMAGTLEGTPPRLPPDVRQNVLLMFKEIVHNSARHASARSVTVRWRLSRNRLWLRIHDDGQGFDPAATATGNGLESLRRRAGEISACLRLDAAPGRGTAIELDVPLDPRAA